MSGIHSIRPSHSDSTTYSCKQRQIFMNNSTKLISLRLFLMFSQLFEFRCTKSTRVSTQQSSTHPRQQQRHAREDIHSKLQAINQTKNKFKVFKFRVWVQSPITGLTAFATNSDMDNGGISPVAGTSSFYSQKRSHSNTALIVK